MGESLKRLNSGKGQDSSIGEYSLRRSSTFGRDTSFSPSIEESNKFTALSAFRPQLKDKFNVLKVEEVLEEVIKEFMKGKTYSSQDAMDWTSELSYAINSKVKLLNFPRYKLITLVLIGENIGGGIMSAMRTQWDDFTDNHATYTYITDSLFVVGSVFGVYYY